MTTRTHATRPSSLRGRVPGEEARTPPARIGERYRVIEPLGQGGMAAVYRVRDAAGTEDIALKQLLVQNDAAADREAQALFEREFYTLAQLKHPSVIEVYDYGVDPGGPYYTMELLDGGDLSARAPLDYRAACMLGIQVCSSLALLHSRRFLHRDITPRNVRCTQAGRAKLIDFGAMVPMGSGAAIVGTPAFVAPEVVHRVALDARADLFSLGATLYFALTGRPAFNVRSFSALREAWSTTPLPPSALAQDTPASLDALVLSLLSIDPARRPGSASEVMQRLCAIAGIANPESEAISQAYLVTPNLVARETQQRRLRQRLLTMVSGRGHALAIEAEAGLGRSRMLDALVLEAKTLGVSVLRLEGSTARKEAFAGAQTLAEQLLEIMPENAVRCARAAKLDVVLFGEARADVELALQRQPLTAASAKRPQLQAALTDWISGVCRERPLLIAVDDAERIDEASLALLAALSHAAKEMKLVVAVVVGPLAKGAVPALDVLLAHASRTKLQPFGSADSEALFRALFGDVPHVGLVADRVHKISGGNPRASMALAQYMVDRDILRYVDGQWVLPSQLAVSELPANAEEALQVRLRALPPLALKLATSQALALDDAWSRADFAQLGSAAERPHVDAALNALLSQGVVVGDGRTFSIAHHSMRACLLSLLPESELAQRHSALAELSIAKAGEANLFTVHHLLRANEDQRALDIVQVLADIPDQASWSDGLPMAPADIAATMERAYRAAVAQGRKPRLIHELARRLVLLSVIADSALYLRYAPAILPRLEHDAGLDDYRASTEEQPAARLQAALARAMERYGQTPESERVYRLDEAIRFLALVLSIAIVIGVRTRDSALLESLPARLEPFAPLSPLLHALWQNLISASEMNHRAQHLRARARALDVYESLAHCSGDELQFVDAIRYAVSFALGALDVSLGNPAAVKWIERLDHDPLQRINGLYLRECLSLFEGDIASAESYRTKAEVLAVQASARQMFDPPAFLRLAANAHARNLIGLKQLTESFTQRARQEPRLRSLMALAQGMYHRLRGDLIAALAAFEECIRLEDPSHTDPPPWLDVWPLAAAGRVSMLTALGRVREAHAFGSAAIERANSLTITHWAHELTREVALAEAKLGDFARAAQRLDAQIAERKQLLPGRAAPDYEARACVAIWAGDSAAAATYAELALQRGGAGDDGARLLRETRLLYEARTSGMEISFLPTEFESAVLGEGDLATRQKLIAKVTFALQRAKNPLSRAQRALKLLCQPVNAPAAQLFLVSSGELKHAASQGEVCSEVVASFVRDYWKKHLRDDIETEVEITQADSLQSTSSVPGTEYRIALLSCRGAHGTIDIGLVALKCARVLSWPATYPQLLSAIATRLYELDDAQGVTLS